MIDISEDSVNAWQEQVLDRSQEALVVGYFTAPWCGPCRMLKPNLEKLETENPGLTVVRIDVDSNPELAKEHRIMSVPTLFFYSAGFQVAVVNGIKQKPFLQEIIDKYL